MKDKVLFGFLAGLIAHFFDTIFSLTVYYLGMSTHRFQDFGAILSFGYRPTNGWESVFAELIVFIFSGFLGILFVYLLPVIKLRYIFFKGWLLGVGAWFFIIVLVTMFSVQGLNIINSITVFLNFLGASIYGVALGLITKRFFVQNT